MRKYRPMLQTGINGFGRFGLHLLKYWLDRSADANFRVAHINDDSLSLDEVLHIIKSDKYVQIPKFYKISVNGNEITFTSPDGIKNSLTYSKAPRDSIPWVGKVDYFLECSGKNTLSKDCKPFLVGNTKKVIISATSWDADKTLVYGFNHDTDSSSDQIVSYGSCTVNAYVPLASYLHKTFGIIDSDVNVIHNIQPYKLSDPANHTMTRKFCTLEKSGPNLLGFIGPENFIVNYTIVPYAGVSLIDFRFRLKDTEGGLDRIIQSLSEAFSRGPLKHLYTFDETDRGPEAYVCTSYSSVLIRDKAKLLQNNLYLQCYFDNENSVNRYFDLVNYLSRSRSIRASKATAPLETTL